MKYPYDHPGVYAIHVAGKLDASWADRLGGLRISYIDETEKDSHPVSVLSGQLPDQAALYGVLNTLYNYHFPLLFVRYLRAG